jgi:hypothetical protein
MDNKYAGMTVNEHLVGGLMDEDLNVLSVRKIRMKLFAF